MEIKTNYTQSMAIVSLFTHTNQNQIPTMKKNPEKWRRDFCGYFLGIELFLGENLILNHSFNLDHLLNIYVRIMTIISLLFGVTPLPHILKIFVLKQLITSNKYEWNILKPYIESELVGMNPNWF